MKLKDFINLNDNRKSNITQLNLSIELPDENELEASGFAVAKCQRLQELDLSNNFFEFFSNEGLQIFFNSFSKCQTLQTINLSGNSFRTLETEKLQIIFQSLIDCLGLKEISLNQNYSYDFQDALQFQFLETFFTKCQNLQTIHFNENNLGALNAENIMIFNRALGSCKNLKKIYLNKNCLTILSDKQVQEFFESLAKCEKLETIDLSDNDIQYLDNLRLNYWIEGFKKCVNLQEILGLDGLELEKRVLIKTMLANNLLSIATGETKNQREGKEVRSLVFLSVKKVADKVEIPIENLPKDFQLTIENYRVKKKYN